MGREAFPSNPATETRMRKNSLDCIPKLVGKANLHFTDFDISPFL